MKLSLTTMMYHYVRDPGDAAEQGSGIPGLSVQVFAAQVDRLARDYNMVSWADVRGAVCDEKPLPERACLLTFDDGLCDHYLNVFPILKQRNLSGLFFIMARRDGNIMPLPFKLHYLIAKLGLDGTREAIWTRLTEIQRGTYRRAEARNRLRWSSETDVVKGVFQRELEPEIDPFLHELLQEHVGPEAELARGLFLSEEQLREMRAGGMHFGGHSVTHPWFDFIDAVRREKEIRASHKVLSNIEQAPFAFAYPYGGLADNAPELFRQSQFAAAFTTREQTENTDAYYIGRYDGEDWHG